MKKRENGEGTIRLRDDGSWEGRYYFDGKRHSVYGRTKTQVRERIAEIESDISNHIHVEDSGLTVDQWFDVWLKNHLPDAKKATLHKYDSMIRNHISPHIGNIKLIDLTTITIQSFYNALVRREHLSAKTVKDIHGIVHKGLKKAITMGYIAKNVSDYCELPKVNRKEMSIIADSNIAPFLHAIKGDEFEDAIFVTMFTGMRESEVVGLTWDCIDFDEGTIRIYRQYSVERTIDGSKPQYKFHTLKNNRARIVMPPSQVMDVLTEVKRKQEENRNNIPGGWMNRENFVFTNQIGDHLHTATLYNHLKRIVRSIGMDDVRFHDLRHTYATLAIENGCDMKTLSDSLGHATTAFTMDVYGHVTKQMKRKNAQQMERFLGVVKNQAVGVE